jgi:hypothetical protein
VRVASMAVTDSFSSTSRLAFWWLELRQRSTT